MRSHSTSSLQKTYDECYRACSIAVYFESQNNEAEALRSWKSALDRINERNATRPPAQRNNATSSTDQALQESLRQLELQCRERVDLLEVLQRSREEARNTGVLPTEGADSSSAGLGGGTVPPATYTDLSRPPLPPRPSPPGRGRVSSDDSARLPRTPGAYTAHSLSPGPTASMEESRTPSPEKRTRMLRTLRQNGKEGRRPSTQKASSSSSSRPPVAAKAATLAFASTASANTRRPLYRATPASSESLVPSQPTSSRTSLDLRPTTSRTSLERPSSRVEPPNALASSAAARSWSDLGSERLYGLHRQPASRTPRPSSPNHGRLRDPESTPSLEYVAVEAGGDREQKDTVEGGSKSSQAVRRKGVPPVSHADDADASESDTTSDPWEERVRGLLTSLPRGVDESAAKQILNEIVIQGDEVHWDDIAGLDVAKSALKETVVYPFLRPDLFMGLREPARGMLLFGPPGTGKTMLARAVATEAKSTFFAISASSLTSKFLGESEKLVRALFALAKQLAPSIIFVDEIDSLLSSRSGSDEHEATRRIKTEFLIQWSDLAKAAAGREQTISENKKAGSRDHGDATRVLVLAATNLPWVIDDAARRRFVRRQYIPLPEGHVRKTQLKTLLSHQKHEIGDCEMDRLVSLTEGFSGSDITALAKDAAMGPLRSLGEHVLQMSMEDIRPIRFEDFEASLRTIRPSVSQAGLRRYEEWAKEFGERAG